MTEHYYSVRPESKAEVGLVRTHLCGKFYEFLTASSVFSRKRLDAGTRLLIESMILPKSGLVLDVGCGYGPVGIVAASINPSLRVIMTDVNIRAVRLAQENVGRNKVSNAEVRWGHLYEPVEGLECNCVLSNPPVSAGMETVKSIISEAPGIMAAKAEFQMVVQSKIGGKILPAFLEAVFGNVRVLSRQSGYRVLLAEKTG